jgi:hypothetical protein
MPQALIIFVGEVAAFIVGGLTTFGLTEAAAIFVLDIGIKVAGLTLLGALAGKLVDIPDVAQTAVSNLVTVRGTLEHQRIIYGEVLTSGPLWYMNTAGTHGQSLYHAVMVAGHEIEDMTDMWLDEHVIPNDAIDWAGNGSVDSGDFRGNLAENTTVYFEKHLGGFNQDASSFLQTGFAEVTSQHQGRGIAYFVARTDYFENQTQVWSAGAPKNFRALVKGKKVYNPNSDDTQAWGTGPHRLTNSLTWEYSNNPALCWADYMIDSKLGLGEDSSRINYAYVASVAAVCSDHVWTPVDSAARFTCNGILNAGTGHRGNLAAILSAGNMTMALVQGQWKLRGWEYETPTLQFTDDDLRGDIQISLSVEESKRYNTMRGTFVDKNRKWTAQQFPVFTSSEYVSRDNDETLFKDLQLPMTTDVYEAQRLAVGVLEQSDLQRTIIYPSNFKTLPVEIGGTIMLSNTKMGWDQDTFRVTNYALNDMAGIDLVLQEDNEAAYTDVGTAEYIVSSQGSYTRGDPGVPPPSSAWVSDSVNGILVDWLPPPARLYETVEVWVSSGANEVSSAYKVFEGEQSEFLHKLDAPATQYYWLRSKNFAGDVSSYIPSSDSTDLIGFGAQFETLHDRTFDKSSGIEDFWTIQGIVDDGFSATLVQSVGIGDTQSARFINSFENHNVIYLKEKVNHQIITTSMSVRVHYRVECAHGFSDQNSQGLFFYALGWSTDPLPPRVPPVISNSGTHIVADTVRVPVASLTTTGSWDTFDVGLSQNSSWLTGRKLGNLGVGIFQDASNPASNYLDVYIDNVTVRYVG